MPDRRRPRVAARKSIIGKLVHQRENLLGLFFLDASLDRAVNKLLLMQGHLLALLLAHRPAHQVGFAERVAGQLLRQLHDLLLIDEHAKGVAQDLLHLRHEVAHRLLARDAAG